VVRSDFKIDEDWERKLGERERRKYGEEEIEIRKKENKETVRGSLLPDKIIIRLN